VRLFVIIGLLLCLFSPAGLIEAQQGDDLALSAEVSAVETEDSASGPLIQRAQAVTPAAAGTPSTAVLDPVSSEEQPSKKLAGEELMKLPVSLDLRNIDIIEALKFLSSKGTFNIVTTKNVSGRVTLTLENVPLGDVFDIMLRSNGLAYVTKGDIYYVMTEAEYKTIYGKNFYDIRQVRIFQLRYAIPEQAFNLFDALKSEVGRVLVDQESGNVLIMDTPEKLKQMEGVLAEFERRATVKVHPLQYARAKDVVEILKLRLEGKKVGSIVADERNNQVIVQTLPERMQEVEALLKDLDKQTKEVLIDTKIVKVKLSDQLDTGMEWEGIFGLMRQNGLSYLGSYPYSAVQASTANWRSRQEVLSDMGGSVGSYPFSGTTSTYNAGTKASPGQNIHYGVINNNQDFDLIFQLLNTLGTTQLLSNPKIVAVNNQEAKIHVGERQAYVTTTTTTGQTTSTISEDVQFVDIGIQLAVTPSINDEGFIVMKIRPEVSSVASTLVTPTNNRIPIVDTSLTETTVLVKDGTTIVVGGLRKEEKTKSFEQFPIISKIPILGIPFRSGYDKTERTELLVLLTPHIITGDKVISGKEGFFGSDEPKDYRDYKDFEGRRLLQKEGDGNARQPAAGEEPRIKPLRESLSLQESKPNDPKDEAFLIKGPRYDSN